MLTFLCILGWYIGGIIAISLCIREINKQIVYDDIPVILIMAIVGLPYIGTWIRMKIDKSLLKKSSKNIILPKEKIIKKIEEIYSRVEILDL